MDSPLGNRGPIVRLIALLQRRKGQLSHNRAPIVEKRGMNQRRRLTPNKDRMISRPAVDAAERIMLLTAGEPRMSVTMLIASPPLFCVGAGACRAAGC